MKGYYLLYDTFNLENPDGVEKKIISQRELFRQNGIEIDFYILKKINGSFWNSPIEMTDADFIYFRRGTAVDFRFLQFFKRLKAKNPTAIIFMEIPTFPYENEYEHSFRSSVILMIDHFFRRMLYKYIDRLVIVNNHSESIWGIKVINLVNGIDLDSFNPRRPKKTDDTIRICCVAKFSPWHGYERIIRGLSVYYASPVQTEVKLIMVGTGVETVKYQELVQSLHLEEYVDFRGQLMGEELEKVYDECDIGCCSLGRYKSRIEMTSELKSRELMAKGLPMICGCKIDVLEGENYPYALHFANDDSNIDIHKVVQFYKEIHTGKSDREIVEEIRKFAGLHIDMKSTFQSIIDEVKQLCGR